MHTPSPHLPVESRVLRFTRQFILAVALGGLALTAGIIVLAGIDVLASPVTVAVLLAFVAMWVVHVVALRRHRADQELHQEMNRARERRGY